MNLYMVIISIVMGITLSTIYFGGLWYTVKNIESLHRPYFLMIGSYLVRTSTVLFGFYSLLIHHWSYLVVALPAFIITRQVIINWTKKTINVNCGGSHGI